MQECDTSNPIRVAVLVTVSIMLLLIVLPVLAYAAVKHRRRRAQHEKFVHQQVMAAISTLRRLDCPGIYIRADRFCELGRLRPHEQLRDAGMLTFVDTMDQLRHPELFTVFLSHQWLSTTEPDPDDLQYPVMVATVKKLAYSIVDGAFTEARFLSHTAMPHDGDRAQPPQHVDVEQMQRVLAKVYVWVDYIR